MRIGVVGDGLRENEKRVVKMGMEWGMGTMNWGELGIVSRGSQVQSVLGQHDRRHFGRGNRCGWQWVDARMSVRPTSANARMLVTDRFRFKSL